MRAILTVVISAGLLSLLSACMSSQKQSANTASTGQPAVTGILIDQACGATMMQKSDPEKAAADHPKSCAMKASCEASGYAVISGNEMIKFDDNGNQLAKDFLSKTDKTDHLKVTVEGTRTGDTIAVTSITPAS
jgi:hypothetical protein